MLCESDDLPDTFFLDEAREGWLDAPEELEHGDWKMLRQCSGCLALWSVDAWDKGHHQVVARVSNRERWQSEAEATDRRGETFSPQRSPGDGRSGETLCPVAQGGAGVRAHGFRKARQKGSHKQFRNPDGRGTTVSISQGTRTTQSPNTRCLHNHTHPRETQ